MSRDSPSFHIASEASLAHVGLQEAGDRVRPPAACGVASLERLTTFVDVVLRTLRRRRLVIFRTQIRLVGHVPSVRPDAYLSLGIACQPGNNREANKVTLARALPLDSSGFPSLTRITGGGEP